MLLERQKRLVRRATWEILRRVIAKGLYSVGQR